MFGSIGITELILIGGIALIFLGPEKFPEFAKIMARTVRDIRGYVADAQKDIAQELKPVKDELDKLSKVDPEAYLERLADSANEDEEWDNINLEPDPSILDAVPDPESESAEPATPDESEESSVAPDGAVAYEQSTPAHEEPEPGTRDLDG